MECVKKPFFSVVLPIYNVEKYLERCIQSIIEQDFNDYEIILVDDGATDSSSKICEKWESKDKRIKHVRKTNGGLGYARNTGLINSNGEYIFFIDSDDFILPGLFSRVYNEIVQNTPDVVFYGYRRIDRTGKTISELIPNPEKELYADKDEIKNTLLPDFIAKNPHNGKNSNIRVSAWNCCIKISMLRARNLEFVSEREYISEDLVFYINLFNDLRSVLFIKEPFYCYCQNEGSLTFSYKPNRYDRIKKCYMYVERRADELGYTGELQLRLKASFIANVLGCLKMEAGNEKSAGFKTTYNNLKCISHDKYLIKAIREYPSTYYSRSWRVLRHCILNKHTLILYLFLKLQFHFKGV